MDSNNQKKICVYCSSSNAIDKSHFSEARRLGEEMARRGHGLVYGGGDIGSMGVLAHSVQASGGTVVGIIPHALNEIEGVGWDGVDELIVTETMRQRKAIMEENSDAFIALPGGLGTFEELLEIITLKQLHYHSKPIVILNSSGYYDPLIALFDHAVEQRFAKSATLALYHVSDTIEDALDYIESYEAEPVVKKWFFEEPIGEEPQAALE